MLAVASERTQLPPSDRVDALAATLAGHASRFDGEKDSRAIFTTAYMCLTRELAFSLKTDVFADPAWIAQLAEVFASYYFDAIRAHDEGSLPHGAWATVFRALEQRRTSVLEDLVLGMTAHIVNDLPQALCDVCMETADGLSRVGDFHQMNEILGNAIENVQAAISKRYDGGLGVLDHIIESYDELLTNYGLRVSRAAAWYNAVRLLDPRSREATLASISRSPEVVLNELLNPPIWSLRLLVRGARLLSRACRRWPSDESASLGRYG